MPIRVTTIPEAGRTLVKIDGWFKAEDIQEFVGLCRQVVGYKALDLRELHSADREAIVVLRELMMSGVKLQAASPYVELLLNIEPECPPIQPEFSAWRSRRRNARDG